MDQVTPSENDTRIQGVGFTQSNAFGWDESWEPKSALQQSESQAPSLRSPTGVVECWDEIRIDNRFQVRCDSKGMQQSVFSIPQTVYHSVPRSNNFLPLPALTRLSSPPASVHEADKQHRTKAVVRDCQIAALPFGPFDFPGEADWCKDRNNWAAP